MEECKYFFKDLVYIELVDEKIIGEVDGHRITNDGHILYKVALVSMYVPETMIHKLTSEQEIMYNKFMYAYCGCNNREEFIREMQNIFE